MGNPAERALPNEPLVRGDARTSAEPRSRVPAPTLLRFMVPGQAVPKGSRSIFNGRSVESSKKWPAWKKTVASYALAERVKADVPIQTGPIRLFVTFYLHRPQRPKDERHITKPDTDKLLRGICDALTGVLWVDDSQVDYITGWKVYSDTTPYTFIQVFV